MKRSILVLSMMLLTAGLSYGQEKNAKQSLPIGQEIPMAGKEFPTANRKTVTLEGMKTKAGLLVMFSCNTCPYVVKSQQRTKEAMAYAASKGIGMVIVNSNAAQRDEDDSYAAMKEYAQKQGYRVPYVADDKSELADAFGALRTPEVFLFDGSGKLVYKGAMEDNPSNPSESKQMFLQQAVDNMLAGKPIDPNTTRSVGCGIKRL
jgi:thioredoxin-related protein